MEFPVRALILSLAVATLPAQAQLRRDGEHTVQPSAPPAGDITRGVSPRRHGAPRSDRCANFRAELRDARRAEREALTTTQSDQASLRRQRILEQSQKAGC